jgi:hypothetical protein
MRGSPRNIQQLIGIVIGTECCVAALLPALVSIVRGRHHKRARVSRDEVTLGGEANVGTWPRAEDIENNFVDWIDSLLEAGEVKIAVHFPILSILEVGVTWRAVLVLVVLLAKM